MNRQEVIAHYRNNPKVSVLIIGGGALQVAHGAVVTGTMDFAGGDASVAMAGLADLGQGRLLGTGSASFGVSAHSATIFPAGFDPQTEFGTFTNDGSYAGSRMIDVALVREMEIAEALLFELHQIFFEVLESPPWLFETFPLQAVAEPIRERCVSGAKPGELVDMGGRNSCVSQ